MHALGFYFGSWEFESRRFLIFFLVFLAPPKRSASSSESDLEDSRGKLTSKVPNTQPKPVTLMTPSAPLLTPVQNRLPGTQSLPPPESPHNFGQSPRGFRVYPSLSGFSAHRTPTNDPQIHFSHRNRSRTSAVLPQIDEQMTPRASNNVRRSRGHLSSDESDDGFPSPSSSVSMTTPMENSCDSSPSTVQSTPKVRKTLRNGKTLFF